MFPILRESLSPRHGRLPLSPGLFQRVRLGALEACPLWEPTVRPGAPGAGAAGLLGARPYPELRAPRAARSGFLCPRC